MPLEPCVILSKHQSAWETMTIQDYVPQGAYCVFVLKKELLRVPLIGWGLGAMKMISIDRAAGKLALDLVVEQGRERLQKGFYVIIFPEGTRVAPGETRRYKAGGAYLATQVGCKVVPVAHNSGELWPRQAFIKKPGVVELAYADVPTACFGTLTNLIMGTATRLKEITCPTLVIHGREDHVVPAVNATIVTSGVSSDDVRLLWLNESYHVATLDNDKDVIVNSIGRFFNEIAEA